MVSLVTRRVRTTPPTDPSQPDWLNPICAGLVALFLLTPDGALGWDETGASWHPLYNSGGTQTGIPVNLSDGPGAKLVGQSSPYICQGFLSPSITTGVYSLFAAGAASNTGTYSALDDDNGTARHFQFRVVNGQVQFIPFSSGSNVTVSPSNTLSAIEASNGFTMGATANATTVCAYLNKTKASAAFAGTLTPSSINVGQRKTGSSQGWIVGGIQVFAVWNRCLSESEMLSLADNRWQLFKPAARRLYLAWTAAIGLLTTEVINGVDLASAVYFTAAQAAEILAAAETLSTKLTSDASVSDLLTASENLQTLARWASQVTDSNTSSDSTSTGASTGSLAQSEALTSTDALASVGNFAGNTLDVLSSTDSQTTVATFVSSLLESLGVGDQQFVAGSTYNSTSSETLAVVEAVSQSFTEQSATVETLSTIDQLSSFLGGAIDPNFVPKSRWVVFDGGTRLVVFPGTNRIVVFEGTNRTVTFEGTTRIVEF